MGPLSEESGDTAAHVVENATGVASMGPLSEESGDIPPGAGAAAHMHLLQWGRSPKRAETLKALDSIGPCRQASMGPLSEESGDDSRTGQSGSALRCFNGAALRRERRRAGFGVLANPVMELQWGRSPKRAETQVTSSAAAHVRLASMGPLSEESGDASTLSAGVTAWQSFNGAALRRERRQGGWGHSVGGSSLLQWGRSPKRAETNPMNLTFQTSQLLQWGRSPKRAETWHEVGQPANHHPLQWGRSPKRAETREPASEPASTNGLQWGRSPKRAETLLRQFPGLDIILLQWGRSPKRAETTGPPSGILDHLFASMGPLSEESGDHCIIGCRQLRFSRLQWGRSPKRAETGHQAGRFLVPRIVASMGPLSEESGDKVVCVVAFNVLSRFNGAALRRERRPTTSLHISHTPSSFNGAALRRERRPAATAAETSGTWTLQWGRSPKRAETTADTNPNGEE